MEIYNIVYNIVCNLDYFFKHWETRLENNWISFIRPENDFSRSSEQHSESLKLNNTYNPCKRCTFTNIILTIFNRLSQRHQHRHRARCLERPACSHIHLSFHTSCLYSHKFIVYLNTGWTIQHFRESYRSLRFVAQFTINSESTIATPFCVPKYRKLYICKTWGYSRNTLT